LNRKALDSRFVELSSQAAVSDGWVSLIECDLDRFKQVNDLHGHDRGDAALKDAVHVLRKNLRSFELVYRLGGEEFLVVLPGVAPGEAALLAERVRSGLEEARPGGVELTASFGVAGARGADVDFQQLFRCADQALYAAKDRGRNRVEWSGTEDVPGRPVAPDRDFAAPLARR
jgi:diguanylate cyclase (GGDEF)-like protein